LNRDPFDKDEHLPPWLRDVPLPPRPASMGDAPVEPAPASQPAPAAAKQPPAPPPTESSDLPDWLKDFDSARTPEQPTSQADAPTWLRGPVDAPAAQSTNQDALPAWLRDADASPAAAQSEDQQLPTWLRERSAEPAPEAEPAASDIPEWARAPSTPREEPPAAGPPATSGPPPNAAPPEAAELPAWLRDLSTEPVADTLGGASDRPPGQDASSAAAPDLNAGLDLWADESASLRPPPASQEGSGTGSTPPAAPDQSAPPAADDAGIPSWLRDISSDDVRAAMGDADEHSTAEPFSLDELPESQLTESTGGLPAWLADLTESEPSSAGSISSWFDDAPPAPPVAPPSDRDVPPWLQNLDSSMAESTSPPAPLASNITDAPDSRLPTNAPSDEAHTPEPAAPTAPELPAWLQDVEQSRPPRGGSAGELPAWLRAEAAESSQSAEDVPAWLRDETPAAPQAEPEAPAWLATDAPVEPPAEIEAPAWLRAELPAAPAAPAAPADRPPPEPPAKQPTAPSGPPDTELPVWLRSDTAAATDDANQLPDWLRTSQPTSPAAAAPPPTEPSGPAATGTGEELPPWLRDEAGQPLPTAGAPGDVHLPEWLRGAVTEPPTSPVSEQRRHRPPTPAEPVSPAQLDWFGDAETTETQGRSAGESEFFGGAELPAWLRKAESEPAAEINPADARSLDWLTRLGAIEEESMSAATPTPRLPPRAQPTRSAAQREALTLLERLAAEPFPQATPEPAPAPASLWQRIGLERLLYLLLLVILLVALAVPALTDNLQLETPPEAPGASDLAAQINRLSENDVVMIGYEWDARRISELRPLKEAVLDQLIQKKVKLVLVSTDPQGTLLLFDLRDDLVRANYRTHGEDYILLGYKPGGELALRSLAQDFQGMLRSDFQGNDASEGSLASDVQTGQPRLTSLNDLSMILVLADDSADVQSWMEQVHRSAPQVPLGFLLPAETAPIVQPYLKQQLIYHLAGKQGALAYQQLRSTDAASAALIARDVGQQRLSILIFIGLFVLGAIAVGVAQATTRRRAAP